MLKQAVARDTAWRAGSGGQAVDDPIAQSLDDPSPLLDLLPIGILVCDVAGTVLRYNRRAVELCGRAPQPGEQAEAFLAGLCVPHIAAGQRSSTGRRLVPPFARNSASGGTDTLLMRGDGSRVTVRVSVRREGAGAVMSLEDTTELRQLQSEQLRDIAARGRTEETLQYLASIVDSSSDAIVSKDLDGVITSWNHGAERLFGYTAAEAVGRSITILIPPERMDEEFEILRRIRLGERIEPYDTVRQRKDGSLVEISLAVSPVKNAGGTIIGASKIARDITERNRTIERQTLLLREMSHRVKNLFALAGSVVSLSARFAKTPDDLAHAVRERLSALAKAHDLTLPDFSDGGERIERRTTLHALAMTIVTPFGDIMDESDRITISGPDVAVGGSALTGFALLLHEFATNAAKYGAFSVPTGRVAIEWTVSADELHLVWRERGGPPIDTQEQAEGFGSLLTRATVQGQLGGSIAKSWEPDGLTVRLTVALNRLAS